MNPLHTLRSILVVCFLSLLHAGTAHTQWPTTPASDLVVTNAGGFQTGPVMVSDAAGGALITWQYVDDVNTPSELHVQRIDQAGYLRWGAQGVAICSTMSRYDRYCAMTGDLAGGAFVVWVDERTAPRYKLFGQHLDSNGVALWPDQGVVVSDTGNTWSDSNPQIVRDDSGGVFVFFDRSGFGYRNISGQRIRSDGTRRWTPADRDVTTGGRDDRDMKIVNDGSGVTAVWRMSGVVGYPLVAQRIDQDGNNLWPGPATVASQGTQGDFTIARGDSTSGGTNSMVAVAWSSDGTNKIYAQAIDTAGTRLWGAGPVAICTTAGQHSDVRIINDLMYVGDSSSYYITWKDGRRSGVNADIRAQRLTAAGVPQWTTDGILISDKPNFYSSPSITGLPDGSVVIASYDGRPEGSGIYAHRIARDSTQLWDTAGILVTARTTFSILQTTSDILSESGVIFVMTGYSGSIDDIYAKLLTVAGTFPSSVTSVNLLNSWNLISVPLAVGDFRKSLLFPTSVSSAFAYLPPPTGYAAYETLRTGVGYWLKFPSAQTVPLEGIGIDTDTLYVSSGWNMIGTLSYPALAADVTPMGLLAIQSSFFGFEGVLGYQAEDTLKPGRGYWVKVDRAGNFIIRRPASVAIASHRSRAVTPSGIATTEGLSRLAWKDRAGRERVLHFSSTPGNLPINAYELPPAPPSEIFDVRFSSQRVVETMTPDAGAEGQEFPISISGAEYPLVLTWDVPDDNGGAVLELSFAEGGKRRVPLKRAGSVVFVNDRILAASLRLAGVSTDDVPKVFALEQNYPNPFNPSTSISFSLPVKSFASLKIYDALGREAAALRSGELPAGSYTNHWNADGFPTGVYFYRLVANAVDPTGPGSFVDTKKLILIK